MKTILYTLSFIVLALVGLMGIIIIPQIQAQQVQQVCDYDLEDLIEIAEISHEVGYMCAKSGRPLKTCRTNLEKITARWRESGS